jgi:sulfhydrogenase subunit gamma (sulfur reductase)
MSDQTTVFNVSKVSDAANQLKLLTLDSSNSWTFIPGQVAVLGIEGIGESYFAIASAPEDKNGLEFLVRDGKGAASALFNARKGDVVQGKGPLGKGFPIDNYRGRDILITAIGSAIAPMRSVLRSISYRRDDFGKVSAIFGVRTPADFPFPDEIENWRKTGINVILTMSRPDGTDWTGKTGYVSTHFGEVITELKNPVALMCGMKAMQEQSRDELLKLNVRENEILANY